MSMKEAVACNEKSTEPRRAQRGDYWVLYNYVPMSMAVRCWESVTYTTHADYTFLDNLEPLLERWRAPISIAMHAPGTDFPATLNAIRYSRNCGSPLVSQLVTFHVFFSSKHVPKMVNGQLDGSPDILKSLSPVHQPLSNSRYTVRICKSLWISYNVHMMNEETAIYFCSWKLDRVPPQFFPVNVSCETATQISYKYVSIILSIFSLEIYIMKSAILTFAEQS